MQHYDPYDDDNQPLSAADAMLRRHGVDINPTPGRFNHRKDVDLTDVQEDVLLEVRRQLLDDEPGDSTLEEDDEPLF